MTVDFSNAFANNTNNQDVSDYDGPTKEDYQAWHQRVVDVCGTQSKAKTMSGYISGVISLGRQKMEDASMDWAGTPEQEAAEIEKFPDNYFEDVPDGKGGTKRVKRWPQTNTKGEYPLAFAITVDFPKMVVEGPDGVARPVRMLLNGEYNKKGDKRKSLNPKFPAQYANPKDHGGKFTIKHTSPLYKLAVATGAVEQGQPFTPYDAGKLIGKYANFEMRTYINDNGYFEESIKFKGAVPAEVIEANLLPEIDESTLYFINFDSSENNEEFLSKLRKSIVRAIKTATNYEGSEIQKQLDKNDSIGSNNTSSDSNSTPSDSPERSSDGVEEVNQGQPTGVPVKEAEEAPVTPDEDIPF